MYDLGKIFIVGEKKMSNESNEEKNLSYTYMTAAVLNLKTARNDIGRTEELQERLFGITIPDAKMNHFDTVLVNTDKEKISINHNPEGKDLDDFRYNLPITSYGIEHVVIEVNNVSKTIDFFYRKFGKQLKPKPGKDSWEIISSVDTSNSNLSTGPSGKLLLDSEEFLEIERFISYHPSSSQKSQRIMTNLADSIKRIITDGGNKEEIRDACDKAKLEITGQNSQKFSLLNTLHSITSSLSSEALPVINNFLQGPLKEFCDDTCNNIQKN